MLVAGIVLLVAGAGLVSVGFVQRVRAAASGAAGPQLPRLAVLAGAVLLGTGLAALLGIAANRD